jgi:hypothetical protein
MLAVHHALLEQLLQPLQAAAGQDKKRITQLMYKKLGGHGTPAKNIGHQALLQQSVE